MSSSAGGRSDPTYIMMTQSPIRRLMIRLSAPTIASMLVTSVYNMADTFFVGRIGTSASGAVGIVLAVMAVIQAIGFFFGHGSGNYISRQLGMQNREEAGRMATVGFCCSVFGGLCVTVIGLYFLRPLALFLGSTPTILPYAEDYMRFIVIGAPWMTAALTLNNHLRFQGKTFYAMIGIMSGGLLNIALDPLFIFVLHMGTGGAGLATIISQLASFCLLLTFVQKKALPIQPLKFRPVKADVGEIIGGGLPSLARQVCNSLSALFLNRYAGAAGGDAAIAGMSIVTRIMVFANAAMIGYGQGFQPVCGFNYGAGLMDRVRKAFWFCIRTSTAVLIAVSAVFIIFAPRIIAFFRGGDPDVILIGSAALRWQCFVFALTGFSTLTNMYAQVIGRAVRATLLSAMRSALYFIPVLILLSRLFGLPGIEASQAVADILTFATAIPVYISISREVTREGMLTR